MHYLKRLEHKALHNNLPETFPFKAGSYYMYPAPILLQFPFSPVWIFSTFETYSLLATLALCSQNAPHDHCKIVKNGQNWPLPVLCKIPSNFATVPKTLLAPPHSHWQPLMFKTILVPH